MFKHIVKAGLFSIEGIWAAIKEENAFRLILLQTFAIFIFIIFFPLTYIQIAILLICTSLCIIVELINSSIENIVDLVTSDWHILAKKAKDMSSAAQFIALIFLYLQLFLILIQNI